MRSKPNASPWAVGAADAFEIDQINIYQAFRVGNETSRGGSGRAARFLLIDAIKWTSR